MSAAELLKKTKALSAREREKFLIAILDLAEPMTKRRRNGRQVRWPDIEARAKRISGKRVFPNLVLLEREERAF